MADVEQCIRCGRTVDVTDPDYLDWEATANGESVCDHCVTGQEQQAMDEAMMTTIDRVRENRVRRAAQRRGWQVVKSRARDPHAIGYGTYMILDQSTRGVVQSGLPNGYGLSLEEVEERLTQD